MDEKDRDVDDIRRGPDRAPHSGSSDTTQTFGHDLDLSFVPFGADLTAVERDAIQLVAANEVPDGIADEGGDEPTVDLLTQRLQVHEKTAWMLRSTLK